MLDFVDESRTTYHNTDHDHQFTSTNTNPRRSGTIPGTRTAIPRWSAHILLVGAIVAVAALIAIVAAQTATAGHSAEAFLDDGTDRIVQTNASTAAESYAFYGYLNISNAAGSDQITNVSITAPTGWSITANNTQDWIFYDTNDTLIATTGAEIAAGGYLVFNITIEPPENGTSGVGAFTITTKDTNDDTDSNTVYLAAIDADDTNGYDIAVDVRSYNGSVIAVENGTLVLPNSSLGGSKTLDSGNQDLPDDVLSTDVVADTPSIIQNSGIILWEDGNDFYSKTTKNPGHQIDGSTDGISDDHDGFGLIVEPHNMLKYAATKSIKDTRENVADYEETNDHLNTWTIYCDIIQTYFDSDYSNPSSIFSTRADAYHLAYVKVTSLENASFSNDDTRIYYNLESTKTQYLGTFNCVN